MLVGQNKQREDLMLVFGNWINKYLRQYKKKANSWSISFF